MEDVLLSLLWRETSFRENRRGKQEDFSTTQSQYNMDLKQKLLKQIYEELKELCRKPDMELIQVRTEAWRVMVFPE